MANVRNGRALKSLSAKPQSKLKNKKPNKVSNAIGKKTKTNEITPTKVARSLRKDVNISRIKTRHSTNNHLDEYLTEGLIFERKKKVLKPRKLSGILRLHVNYFELLKKELNLNDNVEVNDEHKFESSENDKNVHISGKNCDKIITRLNGPANGSPTKVIKPQILKCHRETLKCSIELPKNRRDFPKQLNHLSKSTKDRQNSEHEPVEFDTRQHKKSHKSDNCSNKPDQDTHKNNGHLQSERHATKRHHTSAKQNQQSEKHSNKATKQTNNSDANSRKSRKQSQLFEIQRQFSTIHADLNSNKTVEHSNESFKSKSGNQCKTSQISSSIHSSQTKLHAPKSDKTLQCAHESDKKSEKKPKESSKSDKAVLKSSKRIKPSKDDVQSDNHNSTKRERAENYQKKRNNRKVSDRKIFNASAATSADNGIETDKDKHGNSATESLKTFFKISPNAISDDLITTDNGLEIFPIYNKSGNEDTQPKETTPKDPFQCDYCHKVFKFKTDLRRHIYVHIDLKPYPCVFCNERFRQISNLKTHIARRHPDSIPKPHSYNCAYCQRIFFVKSIYNAHVARHNEEDKVFLCELCPKRFHKKTLLREHMYRHTKKFSCSYCQAVYTTNALLTHHVKVKHLGITENLVCHICGKTFSKAAYIRTHLRNFHGDKKVECPICFKQLKGHVADHMRTHANLRPYACTFCGQKFTQSSQLKVHVRSHTGVRPYKCRICNYSFAHTNALNLHVRVHTGEKPFACFKCYMTFNQLPHLRCHMKKIHGQLECYKCSKCDENFDKKKALMSHEEQCKVGQKELSFEEKLNLSVKIPEVESTMSISRMRMLLAILLHSIVDDKRLVALGFNARLIDEVLEDSLEATGYEPLRGAGVPPLTRLKANMEKLFQWTVPAENMLKYRRENKSIEEILEDLTKEK